MHAIAVAAEGDDGGAEDLFGGGVGSLHRHPGGAIAGGADGGVRIHPGAGGDRGVFGGDDAAVLTGAPAEPADAADGNLVRLDGEAGVQHPVDGGEIEFEQFVGFPGVVILDLLDDGDIGDVRGIMVAEARRVRMSRHVGPDQGLHGPLIHGEAVDGGVEEDLHK